MNIKLEIEKEINENIGMIEKQFKGDMRLFKTEDSFLEYQEICLENYRKAGNSLNLLEVEMLRKYLEILLYEFGKLPVLIGPTISNYLINNKQIKSFYKKINYYLSEANELMNDLYIFSENGMMENLLEIQSLKERLKALKKLFFIIDREIETVIEIMKKNGNEEKLTSAYINFVKKETKRIIKRTKLIYECIFHLVKKENNDLKGE